MSVFATLRKKGRKLTLEQERREMIGAGVDPHTESSLINVNSASTPNLADKKLKITGNVRVEKHQSTGGGDEDDDFDLEEDYPTRPRLGLNHSYLTTGFRPGRLERKGSSSSTTSSLSLSSGTSTLPRSKRKGTFTPTTTLRSFVSFMSLGSSLRRRDRKFGGSSHHLRPYELDNSRGASEEIKIKRESVFFTPTPSRKNSQSVPNINTLVTGSKHKRMNMEPGVESNSSTSTDSGKDDDSLGSSSVRLCKTPEEISRDTIILQGIKKFNADPKKGIDFLVDHGLIERTPESVAQYLKDMEGLSKSSVGNYLGEHHDFNVATLKAFVNLHDFTNVLLVQALRQFLWSFRLPGEAQKIDRMMECFANRYCQLNPNIFKSQDTCYLLSYAIIMLNTSLHNANVKDKPTVEQFIRMNRDIDGGEALNTNFIVTLYHSIQAEPFKIPPEDGNDLMLTFFNPDIEGWLWKQGERYKRWKRRWFILSNNCLYYFKFTTDKVPKGIIPLENIVVKATNDRKHFSFSLYKQSHGSPTSTEYIKSCKTLSDGQTVPGRHMSFHLASGNPKERERWMDAISQNSSSHTFYTFLAQKKRDLQAMTRGGTLSRKSKHKKSVRKSQISYPILNTERGGLILTSPSGAHSMEDSTHSQDGDSSSIGDSPYLLHLPASSTSYNSRVSGDSSDDDDDNSSGPHDFSKFPTPVVRRFSELQITSSKSPPGSPRSSVDSLHEPRKKLSLPTQNPLSKNEFELSEGVCTPKILVTSSNDRPLPLTPAGIFPQVLEGTRQIHLVSEESCAGLDLPQTAAKTEADSLIPQLPSLFLPTFNSLEEMSEDSTTPTPGIVLGENPVQFPVPVQVHTSDPIVDHDSHHENKVFSVVPQSEIENSVENSNLKISCDEIAKNLKPLPRPTEKKLVKNFSTSNRSTSIPVPCFCHPGDKEVSTKSVLLSSRIPAYTQTQLTNLPSMPPSRIPVYNGRGSIKKLRRLKSLEEQIKAIGVKQKSITAEGSTDIIVDKESCEKRIKTQESFGEIDKDEYNLVNASTIMNNVEFITEIKDSVYEPVSAFTTPTPIQACNSVLINSVRHTDV